MKFVLLFAALLVELLDSDLSRASGVLFESLIALAIRDLACSKSLIEFCINSYNSLQCPPSKSIFIFYTLQNSAGIIKKRKNSTIEKRIDILLTGILKQNELSRPHLNYGDLKRPGNFKSHDQNLTSELRF